MLVFSDKNNRPQCRTVAATDSVAGDSLQGAIPVSADVWMYQVTDKGLELSATVRGIRYFKDSELN